MRRLLYVLGFVISDLKPDHLSRVASKLDPQCSKNWLQFGYELANDANDTKELCDEVASLDKCYAGGGSRGSTLLDSLSTSHVKLTIGEFRTVANSLHREDICKYIDENLIKTELMCDVKDKHKSKIATMLDKRIKGVNDWKSFVNKYYNSVEKLESIELAIKEADIWSPTDELLKRLKTAMPKLTLEKMKLAAKKIGRIDVEILIDEIICELTSINVVVDEAVIDIC